MATENMGFKEADLISLGEKLASLDLTEPERAALAALISDDDVAGFGRFDQIGGIRVGIRVGIRKAGGQFGIRGPSGNPGVRGPAGDPGIIGGGLPKPGRF